MTPIRVGEPVQYFPASDGLAFPAVVVSATGDIVDLAVCALAASPNPYITSTRFDWVHKANVSPDPADFGHFYKRLTD